MDRKSSDVIEIRNTVPIAITVRMRSEVEKLGCQRLARQRCSDEQFVIVVVEHRIDGRAFIRQRAESIEFTEGSVRVHVRSMGEFLQRVHGEWQRQFLIFGRARRVRSSVAVRRRRSSNTAAAVH